MGQRRPHLLPVDDPLVAITDGTRRQAGDVGPTARLGEQLAPDLLVRGDLGDEARLLLLRSPLQDGGRAHPDADDVERPRHAGAAEFLVDHTRRAHVVALAVVLRRVGGRGPAGVGQPLAPIGVVEFVAEAPRGLAIAALHRVHPSLWQVLLQPGPHLGAGRLLDGRLLGELLLDDSHGSSLLTDRSSLLGHPELLDGPAVASAVKAIQSPHAGAPSA